MSEDKFFTPADLAEMFQTEERKILRWRIQYGWPSLKAGKSIRFTPEQVEQIKAMQSATVAPSAAKPITGQTTRSRRRSA